MTDYADLVVRYFIGVLAGIVIGIAIGNDLRRRVREHLRQQRLGKIVPQVVPFGPQGAFTNATVANQRLGEWKEKRYGWRFLTELGPKELEAFKTALVTGIQAEQFDLPWRNEWTTEWDAMNDVLVVRYR